MKNLKRITALLLALSLVFALTACGSSAPAAAPAPAAEAPAAKAAPVAGLICLHDENSGYDANFINGFIAACESLNVAYSIKKNIDDSNI